MRAILSAIFILCLSIANGQIPPPEHPIEERHPISYWWWVLGVLIAIAIGTAIYRWLKKDPKKDAS